jgi:hypothetical protein
MRLQPYADVPTRRIAQIVADLLVLAWAALWVWIAVIVHGVIVQLAGLGYAVRDRATDVANGLSAAGDGASRVPLVGDDLAGPLDKAGQAASNVAGTGRQAGDLITMLSWPLAVAVVSAPVLFVCGTWLFLRLRYAYQAGAVASLAALPAGQRLLALRALSTRSLPRLLRVHADPLTAWVQGDPVAVAGLARLELSRLGVRAHPLPQAPTAPEITSEPGR